MRNEYYYCEVEYSYELHDFCMVDEPMQVIGASTLKEARKRMVEDYQFKQAYSYRDKGEIKVVYNKRIEGYGSFQVLLYRVEC